MVGGTRGGASSAISPLRSPSPLTRKIAARALVGSLRQSDAPEATEILIGESEPSVQKWLAMAVARSGYTPALIELQKLGARAMDDNARDWIEASKAVLDPFRAARDARSQLQSRDELVRRDGAIHAWGGVRGGVDLSSHLTIACASDHPETRRWAALALHRMGGHVPSEELSANLASGNYLLKEWSLHIVASARITDVRGLVAEIIMAHSSQHPRVLEWAIHAWGVLEADPQADSNLVDVYLSTSDLEVQEAIAAQLARRVTSVGQDFLISMLSEDPHPLIVLAILRELQAGAINPRLSSQLGQVVADIRGRAADLDGLFARAGEHLVPAADRVRLAKIASDPLRRAVLGSELLAGSAQPWEDGRVQATPVQVGVIVALQEEFEQFAAAIDVPLAYDPANEVYTTPVLQSGGVTIELHVALIGRKGAEFAAVAASRLTDNLRLDLLVSMGISGRLDTDLEPGQIVIGDSVTAYAQNARVEGDTAAAFLPAGEPFRADKALSDHAAQLRFRAPESFKEWSGSHERRADELGVPSNPKVVMGPVASGPFVVASEQFAGWIRSHKRDHLAVDMESSGVALAEWASAEPRPRLLVVRGVSDGADAGKKRLDTDSGGGYRRLAMWSASRYLVHVLKTFPSWRTY